MLFQWNWTFSVLRKCSYNFQCSIWWILISLWVQLNLCDKVLPRRWTDLKLNETRHLPIIVRFHADLWWNNNVHCEFLFYFDFFFLSRCRTLNNSFIEIFSLHMLYHMLNEYIAQRMYKIKVTMNGDIKINLKPK